MTLQGKVALVTGASSGIGEATAEALAAAGANVVIAARRVDRLAALEEKLAAQGTKVLSVALDVTDEDACRSAVQQTVDQFGGLDVLVNNAGLMLLGKIEGADTTDWTRMINTNVLGLMFMTHAALPHLLAGGGSIVNISSVAGRVARLGSGAYNASKFAVGAFSEALRQEVTARNVRVILIEPGMVATELRTHITDQEAKANAEARAGQMRQLQAPDIAGAVVWAVTQPDHVAINEVLVRPTDQVL
ncbi:SDR family NAD(P)-dependent oxidoreductase [Actinocrispum sp. NPDC049592]|uniref:SDR family NAD(P)-dependent oxidoreductase n=1 Tax=Actinocrispum sp. NPDC049592 TaxID=3154835 RepID=UPI003438FC96